jgi:uncharacterized protein
LVSQQHVGGAVEQRPGGLFRGTPAYEARTPWKPIEALGVLVIILLLSIGLARLLAKLTDGVPGPLAEILHRSDILSPALIVILTVGTSMLRGGRLREVLALRRPARGWRSYTGAALLWLLVPLLIATALVAVVVVSSSMGQGEVLQESLEGDYRIMQSLDAQWSLIVLFAPVSEELLFRGFLLSALAQTRLGFWGAAIASTGLWTALHAYSLVGLAKVFGFGLFLSWLLWRTGSLRVTIFCHVLNNSVMLLLMLALQRLMDLPAPQ